MRVTIGTVLGSSALACFAALFIDRGLYLGSSAWGVLFWFVGILFLLAAIACIVTWRGATLYENLAQRRKMRKRPRDGVLVSAEGAGMVFGRHTSVFIETLAHPWELNAVEGTGESTIPLLPLAEIAAHLRQYDILCAHVRAISVGYKMFSEIDRAGAAVVSGVGSVPHPIGGRTFIEVAVSLDANANAVDARTRSHETAADGLAHATMVAAERIRRVCTSHGIPARILTPPQVQALHDEMHSDLGALLSTPQWTYTGDAGSGAVQTVVSFVPARYDVPEMIQWGEVAATRNYVEATMSPRTMDTRAEGEGDTFDYALMFKATDPATLEPLRSLGLVREDGHHADRVTHLLPLTKDSNTPEVLVGQPLLSGKGLLVPRGQEPPLGVPAHPLGVHIGNTVRRDRMFMSLERGGSPLWVIGAPEFALRMLVRASILGKRIAVEVPGAAWDYVLDTARSPRLTRTDSMNIEAVLASNDVVFTSPGRIKGVDFTDTCPSVIVVTSQEPPLVPRNWVRPATTDHVPDQPDVVTVHLAGMTSNVPVVCDVAITRPASERSWVAG